MVHHGFYSPIFICANIISISKGSKANLFDSDKYRSIAISSLLGKIVDHIIIVKQSEALKTSNYQFGFKANASTVLCSTMVNETVQYYTENGAKPVYVLLLDTSKAFDKVAFNMFYSMNYVIILCVLRLQSYYTTCIQIKSVAQDGVLNIQTILMYQMVLNKEELYLPYCFIVTMTNCFHN